MALALLPTLAGLLSGGVVAARAQTPGQVAPQQSPPTTAGLLDQLLQTLFPTTTVAPPPAPATTAPPPPAAAGGGAAGAAGSSSGGSSDSSDTTIPASAQAIINSVLRTGSNNDLALIDALAPLTAVGLSEEEASLVGMGQFPVAGEAYWSDDFLMPRFTPEFHLHQGTDVFAARGTPVRAPADGVLSYASEGAGGQAAYVTTADGTYYYMAHLDSFAKNLGSGAHVKQGQVVGFCGSTGNADGGAPHVHFEIHPRGGAAVNPKPTLDRWVTEAIAHVADVLAAYQVGLPRPLTAAGMLRRLDTGSLGGPSSADGPQLWMSNARRENGAVTLAAAGAGDVVAWDPMAKGEQAKALDWLRAQQMAREVLAPLTPKVIEDLFPVSGTG